MTHTAQALVHGQRTTFQAPIATLAIMGIIINWLKRLAETVGDDELKERIAIHANGLDGIAATYQRKAGVMNRPEIPLYNRRN